MNSTACSQCGEKILPHWTLCPVCALPFADAVTARASGSDIGQERHTNLSDLHCVQCKGILTPDAQICPHCHVLIIRRYCSGCSRLIPEQASICPYCATSASAKRSRVKLYMHSTIALMIVGCVVAGLFFLVDRVPDEAPKRVSPLPAITPPVLSEQQPVLNRPQKRAQETSIVEPIPENQNPAVEIPDEPAEDLDWESRGAKLKKGRKLTEKASLLMQQGRYTDASVILTDALRVFPEKTKDLSYGEALYKLGICLRRKGQPAQAIPVLREAMRFPYYRTKVLREVEAATSQIKRAKVSQTGGGTR